MYKHIAAAGKKTSALITDLVEKFTGRQTSVTLYVVIVFF